MDGSTIVAIAAVAVAGITSVMGYFQNINQAKLSREIEELKISSERSKILIERQREREDEYYIQETQALEKVSKTVADIYMECVRMVIDCHTSKLSDDEIEKIWNRDIELFEMENTDLWKVHFLMPFFTRMIDARKAVVGELFEKASQKDEINQKKLESVFSVLDKVYRDVCNAINIQKKALITSNEEELEKYKKEWELVDGFFSVNQLIKMFEETLIDKS